MPNKTATPKDVGVLTAAVGSVGSAANYLSDLAYDLDDAAAREHLANLGATLETEAEVLRQMAYAKIQILQEQEDKDNGDSEDVSADFLYAVYDQRGLTDRGGDNIKWYNPVTELGDVSGSARRTKKRGICVHHSAVKGGFGVHGSRVSYWKGQGIAWENLEVKTPNKIQPASWPVRVPPEYLGQGEEALDRWARAMALADRYRGYVSSEYNTGVPYHAISGPNSVLYLNLDGEWVTWHGNGANNHFLGYAWDANSDVDSFDEDDILRDFEKIVEAYGAEGHFADGLEFTAHCAWTNKPKDPGKLFLEFIVDKVAPRLGATVDLGFKSSSSARSIGEVIGRA